MAYGRISLEQALNSDNFYQLPKVIIGTKYYSKLKAEAKLLFMLCRDRLSASLDSTRKGDMRFVDGDGDIFIYYSIEDLAEDLGWGRDKIMKLKKELIKYGLIDEVRQGLNKANRIYVKNVIADIEILNMEFEEAQAFLNQANEESMPEEPSEEDQSPSNPVKSTEVVKPDFRKSQNSTSKSRKIRLQEVANSDSTYIKQSETKESETKLILLEEDEEKAQGQLSRKVDKASQYDREYIWELVYDQLLKENYASSAADFAMKYFERRYQYALENMKFAKSSEMVAEYVFNGILAEWNQAMRKQGNG